MAMNITLEDHLVAELEEREKEHHLSVEQLVIRILTDAVASAEPVTPREVVARVQATPNPAHQARRRKDRHYARGRKIFPQHQSPEPGGPLRK